jgi:nucleoside transporter
MMLLQFSIWGFSNAILSEYLGNTLNYTGIQIGLIMSMLPLAIIISPILLGPVADTRIPAQRLLFGLHSICCVLSLALSQTTSFPLWISLFGLYCLAFAPTVPLVESITLKQLNSDQAAYSRIRVWGTIGWVLACLFLSGWRWAADQDILTHIPGDLFVFAGLASLMNAVHSLYRLNVPLEIQDSRESPFLYLKRSLENKNFRIFLICGFLMSASATYTIILTPLYFASTSVGISSSSLPAIISIGQVSEVLVLYFILSRFIDSFGIKKTFLLGSLAWFTRIFIYVIGFPAWITVASLVLHGFAFAFVFANGVIYVDKVADVRFQHSAQALFSLVYMGLGSLIGSLSAGALYSVFSTHNAVNWQAVFAIPAIVIGVQSLLFILHFKGPSKDPALTNQSLTG